MLAIAVGSSPTTIRSLIQYYRAPYNKCHGSDSQKLVGKNER